MQTIVRREGAKKQSIKFINKVVLYNFTLKCRMENLSILNNLNYVEFGQSCKWKWKIMFKANQNIDILRKLRGDTAQFL